jgi:nucleoid-associated protein YgaU
VKTRKAIILVHWHEGNPAHEGRPEPISVQYNPTEFTLDKSATFGEVTIPGLDSPLQQFVRGQAEKLTFDLFFDTTESGMGARVVAVTTLTDKIYQLIKIEPTRHAPPMLTFIWSPDFPGANVGGAAAQQSAASAAVGAALESAATDAAETAAPVPGVGDTALDALGASLGGQRRNAFTCVMESIKQKFTLFSPAGVPLRATLTVSLREYKTLDDQIDEIRPSSPDRTHVHTLRQGESLAAVARRHYDSPREWRAVAEANGIDDPRRLDAGVFLRVPRIR